MTIQSRNKRDDNFLTEDYQLLMKVTKNSKLQTKF